MADLRPLVIERDVYLCCLYGAPVTLATCAIDHRKPYSRFKRPVGANRLENLQTLVIGIQLGFSRGVGAGGLGIYELDGDALKVACVIGQWKGKEWVGKPRPRAIDPKQADVVIELKRVKSGK